MFIRNSDISDNSENYVRILKNSVMSNTFDDYIVAIKNKYENEKNEIYSDFLLKPSPAQLREFCLLMHDNGLSNKDKKVFDLFFKTKPDSTLRKAIANFDVEKFKKICNFLNGKSASTSLNSLNLIAILVNFEKRPFSYFLNSEFNNVEVEVIDSIPNNPLVKIQETNKIQPRKNFKKKIAVVFLGIIGITSIGYTAKNIIAPEPQCMQWHKNHYEVVDCTNEDQQGLFKQYDIIPFDENQSKLIKLDVSDTTTFFKNEKPLYWYCKVKGKPEFFNTHGLHPETGKALKPVSKYIINKYVK